VRARFRGLPVPSAAPFREEVEAQPDDGHVEDHVRAYYRVHKEASGLASGESTGHPGTHRAYDEEYRCRARVHPGLEAGHPEQGPAQVGEQNC
jgi:hypothetical protein